MKKLLFVPALLLLASCATNSPSLAPIPKMRPANVPAVLTMPCKDPVQLPEGDLDTAQTVSLWAEDRAALGDCGLRHKSLSDAMSAIEGQGKAR